MSLSKEDLPLVLEAEANCSADYRDGKISKIQFRKRLPFMSRERLLIENSSDA